MWEQEGQAGWESPGRGWVDSTGGIFLLTHRVPPQVCATCSLTLTPTHSPGQPQPPGQWRSAVENGWRPREARVIDRCPGVAMASWIPGPAAEEAERQPGPARRQPVFSAREAWPWLLVVTAPGPPPCRPSWGVLLAPGSLEASRTVFNVPFPPGLPHRPPLGGAWGLLWKSGGSRGPETGCPAASGEGLGARHGALPPPHPSSPAPQPLPHLRSHSRLRELEGTGAGCCGACRDGRTTVSSLLAKDLLPRPVFASCLPGGRGGVGGRWGGAQKPGIHRRRVGRCPGREPVAGDGFTRDRHIPALHAGQSRRLWPLTTAGQWR